MGARCSLGSFSRSSLRALDRDDPYFLGPPPRDPWPCPPAPPLGPPPDGLSARRRERWRLRRAARTLAQYSVIALNWLTLGHPSFAPAEARVRATASPCQEGVRSRIERLCRIAVRLARGGKSDL
eukprot:5361332-Pyramimonas_sp.AAC.1